MNGVYSSELVHCRMQHFVIRGYKKGFFKKKNVLTAVVSVLIFLSIGNLRNGTYRNELRGALTYRR